MDAPLAIEAGGITKSFGEMVAPDGVNLDVADGQIHGLVGLNGAGTTHLLGLLWGLAVTASGSFEILQTPAERVLAVPDGVAGFADRPGVYPSPTAKQNLARLLIGVVVSLAPATGATSSGIAQAN